MEKCRVECAFFFCAGVAGATALLGDLRHPAYLFGMILSVLFLLWSLTIRVIVPQPLELAAELEEQKASRS